MNKNQGLYLKSQRTKSLRRNAGSLTLPFSLAACGGGTGHKPPPPTSNNPPTDIALSATAVDENLDVATVIGLLTTVDRDDNSHTYTVSDNRFEVVSGELRLKTGNSLNHETIQGDGADATISVDVTANDGQASYTETFSITVTDINEAPTGYAFGNTTVLENSFGAVIGSFAVIDEDDGDSHNVSLSDDRFEIAANSETGELELGLRGDVTLDFEAESSIDIEITASDAGGLGYSEVITITVVDNDVPLAVGGSAVIEGLENTSLTITQADLLRHIAGDVSTITNLTASGGTLTDNGDGSWQFTPDDNWWGEVTLSYDVSDETDTLSVSATLTIEEKTFTIPYGEFAGTTLHFNDPLIQFQSNLLGFTETYAGRGYEEVVHINIIPVWDEYSGAGVSIGSTESIDFSHPEFEYTYVVRHADDSLGTSEYDYIGYIPEGSYHGTATAGIMSSSADNGMGLVGIAYGATITGMFGYYGAYGAYDIPTLTHSESDADLYDIVTNSGGPSSNVFFANQWGQTSYAVGAAQKGRGGLGTIWVNSAGNGGRNDASSDSTAFGAVFEMITVGWLTRDGYPVMTHFGSGVHIVAPLGHLGNTNNILTLDRPGSRGFISDLGGSEEFENFDPSVWFSSYATNGHDLEELGLSTGDYTTLGGTSSTTPVVAASVALVLEASGNNIFGSIGLGWRDVQEILALSSRHTGSGFDAIELYGEEHHFWVINGANNFNGGGLHFAPDYGFGLLDVHAAVRLAETWTFQHTSANLVMEHVTMGTGEVITNGAVVEYVLDLNSITDLDIDVITLDLDITHDNWSELQITLISPDGTESIVFDTPGLTAEFFHAQQENLPMTGQLLWTVLSRAFWGENTDGVWTIRIEDMVDNGNSGTVNSITTHFQGDVATDDDTYYWTDDWLVMNEANGGIPELDDNLGINTVNAAAVMADVTLDMSAGSMSKIGGEDAFSLSVSTDITTGITGDGNDTITGLNAGDSAYAMRGDDRIEITNTDFAVIDGYRGDDTLALVTDGMVLDFSSLTGTITGIENFDLTAAGAQTLVFTAADIMALSDSADTLYITGDSDDHVISTGQGWLADGTTIVDDITYNIYTFGTATLYVESNMWQDVG